MKLEKSLFYVLICLLLIGCNPSLNDDYPAGNDASAPLDMLNIDVLNLKDEWYVIDSDTEITIDNMDSENLYIFRTEAIDSKGLEEKNGNSDCILRVRGTFVANPYYGKPINIKGKDFGDSKSRIKMMKMKASESSKVLIDSRVPGEMDYVDAQGYTVTENYFKIDIDDLEKNGVDPSRIVLSYSRDGEGSMTGFYAFGIFTSTKNEVLMGSAAKLFDYSEEDHIKVFFKTRRKYSSETAYAIDSLNITSPVELSIGKSSEFNGKQTAFYVPKASDEGEYGIRVRADGEAELSFPDNVMMVTPDGIVMDYMRPIEKSDSTCTYYIGNNDYDFWFDFGKLKTSSDVKVDVELYKLTDAELPKDNKITIDELPYSFDYDGDCSWFIIDSQDEAVREHLDISFNLFEESGKEIDNDKIIYYEYRNKSDGKVKQTLEVIKEDDYLLEGVWIQYPSWDKLTCNLKHAHDAFSLSIRDHKLLNECDICDYSTSKNYFDGSWAFEISSFGKINITFEGNLITRIYVGSNEDCTPSGSPESNNNWEEDVLETYSKVMGLTVPVVIDIDPLTYKENSFIANIAFKLPEEVTEKDVEFRRIVDTDV